MKKHKIILQLISIMFVFGGFVRLFANETIFEIFRMGNLWTEHAYFIYVYRVLGAFVIFTGLLFYSISRNIDKYLTILHTMKFGFIIIGSTMALTGFYIELPLIFYLPDFIFCFAVALYLRIISNSES